MTSDCPPHQVLDSLELGDSSQLEALAQLVKDDQPGASLAKGHIARNTIASDSRVFKLRQLYTPGSISVGRPLICFSAPRLYDEVPVCHACYAFYLARGEGWKKHPKVLISVASTPALGLIGQPIDELPSECLSEAQRRPPPPPPSAPSAQQQPPTPGEVTKSPLALAVAPSASSVAPSSGGLAGLVTAAESTLGTTPARTASAPGTTPTRIASVPKTAPTTKESRSGAVPGTCSSAGAHTPSSSHKFAHLTDQKEAAAGGPQGGLVGKSHSLELLHKCHQSIQNFGTDSPFAMASRYHMLKHCLQCNILCKACVVEPEELEAQRRKEKAEAEAQAAKRRRGGPGDRKPNRPPSPDKESREYQARQRKLMLSIEAGNEIAGAAAALPLAAAAARAPGAVEPDESQVR